MTLRRVLGSLVVGLLVAGCAHSAPASPAGSHRASGYRDAAYPNTRGVAALRAGLAPRGQDSPYYLSLGDSLAQGIQPGPTGADGPTDDGYPDVLAAMIRTAIPGLRLIKLGCSGETTLTMMHGGICHYPAGSQLAQAVSFLRSHRGHVALVTIDIGANDPNSCVLHQPASHLFSCLSGQVTQTERNVSRIVARIRAAAGPRVLIVGMTYYVPELALWRKGQAGKGLAILTEGLAAGVNQLIVERYHRYGARIADVFAAFKSTDFGRKRADSVTPPNVAAICSLTWMCAPPPRGPNEHANNAGYRVIAGSFWQAINR
ncbi:MAG TPA: SGNH/GDSL hydrolase family protein [Streptosporangiaceae bacterium]|jgi:lysophospholipase L1-like esterase|nr:SGNH/GDSL hydrolase family protein [Streptosporangiaceae bacterium]